LGPKGRKNDCADCSVGRGIRKRGSHSNHDSCATDDDVNNIINNVSRNNNNSSGNNNNNITTNNNNASTINHCHSFNYNNSCFYIINKLGFQHDDAGDNNNNNNNNNNNFINNNTAINHNRYNE
jgi:hypothetical protein